MTFCLPVQLSRPLVRRYLTEPPQGRKAARTGGLWRVREGSLLWQGARMITSQHRKQLLLLTATMAMVVSIFGTWQAAPSHAANYNQTQIDAGLARMQKATPRTDSFMSMEVAPEVTSAVPLKAGMHRLWDMKTAWKDVNPSKGAFDWSVLDARVAQAEASGARPMLVLGLTPTWAASDPNAGDARWGLGTASPPKDINDWKNYVQAVVSRYGGRIAAYEVWNEANLQTFWK